MYHITHVKQLLLWNCLRPASTGLGPESLRLFVRVAQSQLPTSSRTLPVSVWTPVHQPQSVALSSTTKLFHELTSWLRKRNGSPHFTFSLHPSFCNAAFRWDWQSFEKTNVRSIHPQCRYYSWILRHRRLGRFEKTLTPSQTSAWLSFISGVVIRGVHLASSKLTDKEACSIHRYDLVVMLSSRATLMSQSHFKSRLSTPARSLGAGRDKVSQSLREGGPSQASLDRHQWAPSNWRSIIGTDWCSQRAALWGGIQRSHDSQLLPPPFFSSPRFSAGWGRAALLVSVDHAVARGDCQEHLQAGDQETSAEPRWRPASAA